MRYLNLISYREFTQFFINDTHLNFTMTKIPSLHDDVFFFILEDICPFLVTEITINIFHGTFTYIDVHEVMLHNHP